MEDKYSQSNNYEQEFVDKIKQTTPATSAQTAGSSIKSNPSIIVSIILALVVLVESIALTILIANRSTTPVENVDIVEGAEDSPESLSENTSYAFDDDYNIIAFDLTCTADDGTTYTFNKSMSFQKADSSSNIINSGTYSIVNEGAVVLSNPDTAGEDTIVYFDGYQIMENLNFYSCDEE